MNGSPDSQREREPGLSTSIIITQHKKDARKTDKGPIEKRGAFEWRTVGCANVHRVAALLSPYMFVVKKREQMSRVLRSCKGKKCAPNHLPDPTEYEA